MSTSIVAVGASTDLFFIGFARFGAKASESREAMACLSQTAVMLSGKCLQIVSSYTRQTSQIHTGFRLQIHRLPAADPAIYHSSPIPSSSSRLAHPHHLHRQLVANHAGKQNLPLLKHKILTWFPSAGSVNANSVGAKNMASSSGCAISRQILLFVSFGNRDFVTETVYSQQAIATNGRVKRESHSSSMAARSNLVVRGETCWR
jgi:hypothetical protein